LLAFNGSKAVQRAVRQARDFPDFPRCKVKELRPADPEKALAAGHPQMALFIGKNAVDLTIK
jgi:hypothetical protein